MNNEETKTRLWIFIVAFGVAFLLRSWGLGAAPLSEFEADWALQARDVSRHFNVGFGPQPLYVLSTGLWFFLFGASNFMARFTPALLGSSLVFLPYFLRARLGKRSAYILAFGLALDPGLIAASRLAGSPIIALACLAFAVLAWNRQRWNLAGVAIGLALLAGPAVFGGILLVGLVWLIWRLYDATLNKSPFLVSSGADIGKTGKSALITFVLVGTGFGMFPQGVNAFIQSIGSFLAGWGVGGGAPIGTMLAGFVFYQPFALVFAITSVVISWYKQNDEARIGGLALVGGLLLILVYPARQVLDLIWILVIVWYLAALYFPKYIEKPKEPAITYAVAGMLFLFVVMIWLQFVGIDVFGGETEVTRWRFVLMGVISALGLVTAVLAGMGWTWDVTTKGVGLGLGSALLFYTLAASFGVSFVRPGSVTELWNPPPQTGQVDLLLETIGDLSLLDNGRRDAIEIVSQVNTPSVRWVLRNFPNVHYTSSLELSDVPPIILTREGVDTLEKTMSYTGQDFAWWLFPAWDGGLPQDWVKWVAFRQGPVNSVHLVLWVRSDLLPGGSLGIAPEEVEAVDGGSYK